MATTPEVALAATASAFAAPTLTRPEVLPDRHRADAPTPAAADDATAPSEPSDPAPTRAPQPTTAPPVDTAPPVVTAAPAQPTSADSGTNAPNQSEAGVSPAPTVARPAATAVPTSRGSSAPRSPTERTPTPGPSPTPAVSPPAQAQVDAQSSSSAPALKVSALSGAPGDPVTISGSGCTPGSTVKLQLSRGAGDASAATNAEANSEASAEAKSNDAGDFTAVITTRGKPVGHYTITANCGTPQAASFDVVHASTTVQRGGTIALILLILLGVVGIYGPRLWFRGRR